LVDLMVFFGWTCFLVFAGALAEDDGAAADMAGFAKWVKREVGIERAPIRGVRGLK
jgi:hypothetical protein